MFMMGVNKGTQIQEKDGKVGEGNFTLFCPLKLQIGVEENSIYYYSLLNLCSKKCL